MIVTFNKDAGFYHAELNDGVSFEFTPEVLESLRKFHDIEPLTELYNLISMEYDRPASVDELNEFKAAYENCSH